MSSSNLRTTGIYDYVFAPDGTPTSGVVVTATLAPAGNNVRYNVAGAYLGADVQQIILSTTTADAGPVAALSLSTSVVSGALTSGVYKYVLSFMYGEAESVASPINQVTTGGFTSVDMVNIPTGNSTNLDLPICTARRLYRTVVGGSTLFLLATIEDNTTTTFTDSEADVALGTDSPMFLGMWRLNLVAPGDLLPGGLNYTLTQGTLTAPTTSFVYSSTPVLANSIYLFPPSKVILP